MSRFHTYASSLMLACIVGCAGLTSCGDDEPDDNTNRLYQEYEVQVIDYSTVAYANLRQGNASGKRVRLSGASSLEANRREMAYITPVNDTIPAFTYMAIVDPDATSVTFSLNVDASHSIVNSIDLDLVPDVKAVVEDGVVGSSLTLDLNGADAADVSVTLTNPLGMGETLYKGGVANNGSVIFSPAPPAGRYNLNVSCSRTFVTQQNDGGASGTIRLVKSHSQIVTVTK